MELTFRKMDECDLEQVADLEKDSFSMPWSKESFGKSMRDPANIYLVAAEGDQIDGYCGVWVVAGEGQLNNLAVRENCRRKGVGSGIMRKLADEAVKRGLTGITLEVRVGNRAGIALYKKMGFTEAGIRKNFYEKPREDALIMWKYF